MNATKKAMSAVILSMIVAAPLAVTSDAKPVRSKRYCHGHWDWKKFKDVEHCHCFPGVKYYRTTSQLDDCPGF